ncbi:MAG: hypothetical protein U9N59_03645 [Campylobacterota bacterium]|nr:hypothetical protein [Campylobacterota bacterium]
MQTIQLQVKDNYVKNTLEILNGLKDVMIENITIKYSDIEKSKEDEYFTKVSFGSMEKCWDNDEDRVYDKFLK